MLNFEQIKELMKDVNPSSLARETGLHPQTLREIKSGKLTGVYSNTLEKLSDYFEEKYKIIKGE